MPDDTFFLNVVFPLGILVLFVANGYAAYWALTIRRRLFVKDYRTQALGLSFVAVYFLVLGVVSFSFPVDSESTGLPITVNALVDTGYLAIILYWIHTTVTVARRSDPFERDNLRYSITKYIWVSIVVVLVAASLVFNPVGLIITAAVPLPPLLLALGIAPWACGAAFGAGVLYLSASRSRDRTIRVHVRWFGSFSLVSLVNIVVGGAWQEGGGNTGTNGPFFFVFFMGGQLLAAYCLYRSAKSLAPMTKAL
jgi:hypothetical protein